MEKVVVLIDGEHRPEVTAEALRWISSEYRIVAAVCLGGTEKLEDNSSFEVLGVPVAMGSDHLHEMEQVIASYNPERVIDLSDDPVLDHAKRFAIASRVLAMGVTYSGSDFVFTPALSRISSKKASISIVGTGKRVGKTAITGFAARTLSRRFEPIVVTLGRGGPAEPETVYGREMELTPEYLLSLSAQGKHASSDYLEHALTSGVTTIGGRRCGGGLCGQAYLSNIDKCAAVANVTPGDIVLFEGSGSAIPNVATDRRILVIGAHQPLESITQYLGPVRVINSHLVILTMCEEPIVGEDEICAMENAVRKINPGASVVRTVFRPRPLSNVEGKRVILCTTSSLTGLSCMARHLEDAFHCAVVASTNQLSNRAALQEDLDSFGYLGADVVLTELKAAAVDVVTLWGMANGLEVAYMDNQPLPSDTEFDLEEEIFRVASEAIEEHLRIQSSTRCFDWED